MTRKQIIGAFGSIHVSKSKKYNKNCQVIEGTNYLESKVGKYLLELGYTEHDCIPKSYTYQQLVITIFTEITVICATWCKHSMLKYGYTYLH